LLSNVRISPFMCSMGLHGLVALSLWGFASDALTLGVAQQNSSLVIDVMDFVEEKQKKKKNLTTKTSSPKPSEMNLHKSVAANEELSDDASGKQADGTASEETIIDVSGLKSPHPYFTQIWRRLSRESREFGVEAIQESLQLFVSLSLEKSGQISRVHLKVENGQISDRHLKTISSRLQALRRLDPVPDEIADRGIQVIYRLKFSHN
jgi:hypothetical protein